MARKRNEEFDDMTLRQMRAYSDMHPSEGFRMARGCGETKKYCMNNYILYQKDKIVETIIPNFGVLRSLADDN